jgi:mannose-6-phosphate isomerase-like protein (cupin superfamily)
LSGTSRFEERPWGTFEVLADGFSHSKVKYITVLPGKRLSYQSHEHRAEHWIVVEGTAVVTLNDEIIELSVGDFIDVPRGARHRCSNPGGEPLTFVEVQLGDYFGEDDIVRYDDDFGRTT